MVLCEILFQTTPEWEQVSTASKHKISVGAKKTKQEHFCMKIASNKSGLGKLEWSWPKSLRILNHHTINLIDLLYPEC